MGDFKSGWKLECGVHGPFSDIGVHPYSAGAISMRTVRHVLQDVV